MNNTKRKIRSTLLVVFAIAWLAALVGCGEIPKTAIQYTEQTALAIKEASWTIVWGLVLCGILSN